MDKINPFIFNPPSTPSFAPEPEPFVRTPYNYNRSLASWESGLMCADESVTQQQHLEETDINTIVRRFGLTGKLPENVRMPTYGDFMGAVDFHTAQNILVAAEASFMAMPARIRERFGNDPQRFVEFCSDDANLAEARTLGLVPAVEHVEPAPPASKDA